MLRAAKIGTSWLQSDFHWYLLGYFHGAWIYCPKKWHNGDREKGGRFWSIIHDKVPILTYSNWWIGLWSSGGFCLCKIGNFYGKKRPIRGTTCRDVCMREIVISIGTLPKVSTWWNNMWKNEKYDGYIDEWPCVFREASNINDKMAVQIKVNKMKGTSPVIQLTTYSPYEWISKLLLMATKGRIEAWIKEKQALGMKEERGTKSTYQEFWWAEIIVNSFCGGGTWWRRIPDWKG